MPTVDSLKSMPTSPVLHLRLLWSDYTVSFTHYAKLRVECPVGRTGNEASCADARIRYSISLPIVGI
jgi:hypothetical protein